MKYILHSKDYKHTVGSTFGDKPKHQTSIGTIQYHTIPKLFSAVHKNNYKDAVSEVNLISPDL